jgi:threonine dehydratase
LLPILNKIQAATKVVYKAMPPTPQYCWPLLCQSLGAEIWVKHENHTPTGAFKVRGGLVYFAHHASSDVLQAGVISATRGNHGQSIGFAAKRYSIPATIVVPHGNSKEKNAAMRALGVELIEFGDDFQASREKAETMAQELNLHMVPSFHPLLVTGVATYSLELFQVVKDIDIAYVPIGLGSGICGMVAVRDGLNLNTKIVGVVSAHAQAYAKSFEAKMPVESPVATKLADGMACRVPEPDALDIIKRGVDRVVTVTDKEIALAMRTLFECTHNTCEGAGAAATAAAIKDKVNIAGKKVAVILSGGNIDCPVFAGVLSDY